MFLCFSQTFKMATKNGEKTIFGERLAGDSTDTLNFVKIALSRTVSEIFKIFPFDH